MSDTAFQQRYKVLKKLIDRRLASVVPRVMSRDLFQGSRYVLTAPGKRVRATLLLVCCEAVGGSIRDAIDAALAIEMLHNFTLVHDDVMDNAPSRRGRATVHVRWNLSNAILVGDVILGLAYRTLLRKPRRQAQRITHLFTEGFVAVCEGQALDVQFEHLRRVSEEDYYRMIDNKTGRMIATATELGAVIGNGSPSRVSALKRFGTHIGRAFQIQDDLLDVAGDETELGKAVGGDIVEGKKTYLLVKALERVRGSDRDTLSRSMTRRPRDQREKRRLISNVTALYERSGALDAARQQIESETAAGLRALQTLPQTNARSMLQWFAGKLVQRTF
jgi:geranylgeranyl diphosphate synthase type II